MRRLLVLVALLALVAAACDDASNDRRTPLREPEAGDDQESGQAEGESPTGEDVAPPDDLPDQFEVSGALLPATNRWEGGGQLRAGDNDGDDLAFAIVTPVRASGEPVTGDEVGSVAIVWGPGVTASRAFVVSVVRGQIQISLHISTGEAPVDFAQFAGDHEIEEPDPIAGTPGIAALPLTGDFDGDGEDDLGIFMTEGGFFSLYVPDESGDTFSEWTGVEPVDPPVVVDWDQDGVPDLVDIVSMARSDLPEPISGEGFELPAASLPVTDISCFATCP